MDTTKVISAWNILRYSFGIVLVLAGLDKALGTDLIVEWAKYVSPTVASALPVSVTTFLLIIGVIEIVVGVLLLTRYAVMAFYLSVIWLLLISVNLILIGGYLDIAIRDILLAVAALAAAWLGSAIGASKKYAYQ
jgi:uncharacterized membrane protein YphA (DoxX/SURF4 family)